MAYTTIDKPSDYFNTKLTTGTGNSQAVTGLGFQPDWIWGKRRDSTGNHSLFDAVRGITKGLESNSTGAEFTSTDYYSSFDSNGFTIAAGASGAGNGSGQTAVQWCWKAGTSFTNDASSTGIGSIDSTGSVNTDAGFSIVSYTGNGNSGQTIAHGLGSTVDMVIVKDRSRAGENWVIYHKSLGKDKLLLFNTDAAATSSNYWGSSTPNSTVFGVKDGNTSNNWSGDNFIAYCFAEKKGYSKFGSYVGTGVDSGTFSFCGFKPAFVLTKRTDSAGSWVIQDNKRPGYNETSLDLNPNNTEAEETNNGIDMLSNGFKQRNTDAHTNASGGNYIFYAVAENPFVTSTGVPATAR